MGQDAPLLAVGPNQCELGLIGLAGVHPLLDHRLQPLPLAVGIEVQGVAQVGVEGLPAHAVDAIDLVRPFDHAGRPIQPPVAHAGHLLDQAQRLQPFVADAGRVQAGDDVLGHPHQAGQLPQLLGRRLRPGSVVQNAEGAHRPARRVAQGRADEELQMGRLADQGMVFQARIGRGIGRHQGRPRPHRRQDRRQAVLQRNALQTETGVGADDRLSLGQQRHHRRPAVEQGRGEIHQPLKRAAGTFQSLDALVE
ncbi:hypothetical protein D3C80_794040 [compost metagenome]